MVRRKLRMVANREGSLSMKIYKHRRSGVRTETGRDGGVKKNRFKLTAPVSSFRVEMRPLRRLKTENKTSLQVISGVCVRPHRRHKPEELNSENSVLHNCY